MSHEARAHLTTLSELRSRVRCSGLWNKELLTMRRVLSSKLRFTDIALLLGLVLSASVLHASALRVADGPNLPPAPWEGVRVADGPNLPPAPWEGVRVADGPNLPPAPWEGVQVADGPNLPPAPWEGVRVADGPNLPPAPWEGIWLTA